MQLLRQIGALGADPDADCAPDGRTQKPPDGFALGIERRAVRGGLESACPLSIPIGTCRCRMS